MGKVSGEMKLVIQNSSHVWGGNEKMLATLGSGLASRGHDVVVSCAHGVVRERLAERKIRTSFFRPRGSIDPISGLSFAAWLATQKADALLMTSWRAITWASFGARVSSVRNTVLRQGIVRDAPSSGPKRYAVQHWIQNIITNAPEIRDRWIETAPYFPRDHVHVVLNSVTPLAARRNELRSALRREIGCNESDVLIGVAGIIARRKGFNLVMRAIAQIGDPRLRLVIVGDGPDRAELEKLRDELSLGDGVHFLGMRSNAADLIAGFDIFVLASHNEGMANVMLEAMGAGVPVIASDISGVATALGPDESGRSAGWMFRSGDIDALVSRIREVLALAPEQLAEITSESVSRIESRFNLDRMLDESERILFG